MPASGNSDNDTQSSVIFSETFCNMEPTTICADISADTTVMDSAML